MFFIVVLLVSLLFQQSIFFRGEKFLGKLVIRQWFYFGYGGKLSCLYVVLLRVFFIIVMYIAVWSCFRLVYKNGRFQTVVQVKERKYGQEFEGLYMRLESRVREVIECFDKCLGYRYSIVVGFIVSIRRKLLFLLLRGSRLLYVVCEVLGVCQLWFGWF